MDINRATELLLALADGIDPITGNRLPDESVYNNPEIIRAIHCLLRQLQARSDNAAAVNAGRSWHADEERQLLAFHVQNDIIIATKEAGFPGKVQKGSEDL